MINFHGDCFAFSFGTNHLLDSCHLAALFWPRATKCSLETMGLVLFVFATQSQLCDSENKAADLWTLRIRRVVGAARLEALCSVASWT